MRRDVCLTLPTELVSGLDAYAHERQLPRSYAAQELLERSLAAGRARLAELEALAQTGMAKASRPPSTAAEDHLREHARLSRMRDIRNPNDD